MAQARVAETQLTIRSPRKQLSREQSLLASLVERATPRRSARRRSAPSDRRPGHRGRGAGFHAGRDSFPFPGRRCGQARVDPQAEVGARRRFLVKPARGPKDRDDGRQPQCRT